MGMKIDSLKAENYKCIENIELDVKGNDIILSGPNGSGKSSVMELIELVCTGKADGYAKSRILKKDVIRKGEKFAKVELRLRSGDKVRYLTSIKITDKGVYHTLSEVVIVDGKEREIPIKKVADFFQNVVADYTIDPSEMKRLSGQEMVEMVYQIAPELREKIKEIDNRIAVAKQDRSEIRADGERYKHELESIQFTDGLPEDEIAVTDLMAELGKANEHNSQLEEMKAYVEKNIYARDNDIEKANSIESDIVDLQNTINQMQKKIADKREQMAAIDKEIVIFDESISETMKKIDGFVMQNTEEIQKRISECQETNAKIRANKEHNRLSDLVKISREQYSSGLEEMKKLEQEKIEAIKAAELPAEGLSIGDGCLMCNHPETGEQVRVDTLSEGQFYTVALDLHAALLKKDGLRVVFIKNLNALDDIALEALDAAKERHGLQLIAHETIRNEKAERMGILVVDGKVKE